MKKNAKEELNVNSTLSAQGLSDSAPVSDEQLLQSYRTASDPTVFAELVSRYQRELYNYLRRFLGDATLAEDVFQATFFQVHQKRVAQQIDVVWVHNTRSIIWRTAGRPKCV